MSLSTAQVNALRAVRVSNDNNGRGLIAPVGPASRPYKFLVKTGLLEKKANETLHHITPAGREALQRVDAGTTRTPGDAP